MQVGKKDLPCTQKREFLELRFLDLHDQIGVERLGVRGYNFSPCVGVFGIGIPAAHARVALDKHTVARLGELIGSRRKQSHTVFLFFDFTRNSNFHNFMVWVD